ARLKASAKRLDLALNQQFHEQTRALLKEQQLKFEMEYGRGVQFLSRKRYDEAIRALTIAMKLDPTDMRTRLLLNRALAERRSSKVEAGLDKTVKNFRPLTVAQYLDDAPQAKAAIRDDANKKKYLIEQELKREGKLAECQMKARAQARPKTTPTAERAANMEYEKGLQMIQDKDYLGAIKALDVALALNPGDARILKAKERVLMAGQ
ncbi:MAG: hypothetical protein HQL19_07875, partial [Candidatus Omnitrophica bacterium]|nr:hypothetical protein [Candidatus Omnitrophota bacterium]